MLVIEMSVVSVSPHNVQGPCHFIARRATKPWPAVQQRSVKVSAKTKKRANDQRKVKKQTEEADGVDTLREGEGQDNTEVQLSRSGKEMGWKLFPKEDDNDVNAADAADDSQQDALYPFQEATDTVPEQEDLPEASRGRVFAACVQTSLVLLVFAFLLRARAAALSAAVLHTDPEQVNRLLTFPHHVEISHLVVALGCAAVISGLRWLLLERWPAFAEATDRSNQQVLQNLAPLDLIWVSFLPGVSEELLFRGALIPSLYPDWRGVLIAGVGFGVLHKSGGRNWSFAGWASLVGILYGFAFVQTQDIYVAMGAHSLANLVSASLWLQYRQKSS